MPVAAPRVMGSSAFQPCNGHRFWLPPVSLSAEFYSATSYFLIYLGYEEFQIFTGGCRVRSGAYKGRSDFLVSHSGDVLFREFSPVWHLYDCRTHWRAVHSHHP